MNKIYAKLMKESIFKIIYILIIYFFHRQNFCFYSQIFREKEIKLNKKNINNFAMNGNNTNESNYLTKLKKVVYTIVLGKYDTIKSIIKEKGYSYFLITDQIIENKNKLNWTILHIDKKFNFSNKIQIIKIQRFYKTHPHIFFQNYDLSIYIDATFEIKGNLDDFLLRILTPYKSIYILEHPTRNSINKEFNRVIFLKKESNKIIAHLKEKYNFEKFPDKNGLAETCLIIRRHNEFKCKQFMEQWYKEIEKNSHRDQLSFNYILWKTRYMHKIIKYIPKKYLSKYFLQKPEHLKLVEFK